MIFCPKRVQKTEGSFLIPNTVYALAHPCLCKPGLGELWQGFTLGASTLISEERNGFIFSVGEAPALSPGDYDYGISIKPNGIFIGAKSAQALIHGFMTLLDCFKAIEIDGEMRIAVDCAEIRDSASIKERMVHFCVFPETELWELRRFLRFAAALKYTHVILEFWGTLRLDCLKELAWPNSFTQEEIRPLLREASDLGLAIVPMFNHWGHASLSRAMHGKHVVLDQNPALQTYFSDDGWCWDIKNPKVRTLLRSIRKELIDLCGDPPYFHIGCDEAYGFDFSQESMDFICDFLNEIVTEAATDGRRIIAWGDMFLSGHDHYANAYTCNAPSAEAEQYMLARLDRRLILADWQYDATHAPVETALVFKKAGFDCMLCPWDKGRAQLDACIDTARDESLLGVIHTTWHTLTSGMPFVLLSAIKSFDGSNSMPLLAAYGHTAALLRRVMPESKDYEKAGWSKRQVSCKW